MNLLALTFIALVAQEGTPAQDTNVEQEPTVSQEQIEETISMVRDALDLCREAQVIGDLDEARLHVRGALEVMQALGENHDPTLIGILGVFLSSGMRHRHERGE